MTSDARVQQVRELLESLLPQLEMPGLLVAGLGFDFVRQSFVLSFQRHGENVTMILPVERVADLESGSHFAVKHFRRDVEAAFGR